jgi:hypothetical protein
MTPFYVPSHVNHLTSGPDGKRVVMRNITLPRGGVLEVSMTDDFVQRVRKQFDLANVDEVTDDHVRMFIFSAVKGGLDRHEAGDPG